MSRDLSSAAHSELPAGRSSTIRMGRHAHQPGLCAAAHGPELKASGTRGLKALRCPVILARLRPPVLWNESLAHEHRHSAAYVSGADLCPASLLVRPWLRDPAALRLGSRCRI